MNVPQPTGWLRPRTPRPVMNIFPARTAPIPKHVSATRKQTHHFQLGKRSSGAQTSLFTSAKVLLFVTRMSGSYLITSVVLDMGGPFFFVPNFAEVRDHRPGVEIL